MSLFSRFSPFGKRAPRSSGDSSRDRHGALLADYLDEGSRPKALDPMFDILLERRLRWEIAPDGTLQRLPLTADQREQYDFVAVCPGGDESLYLLDSRPVWLPDIPYIPSFLLLAAEVGLKTVKPIGTFDGKPDKWVFAWRSEGAPA
jgi:hypothetical protein